jgi:hypothetical protein
MLENLKASLMEMEQLYNNDTIRVLNCIDKKCNMKYKSKVNKAKEIIYRVIKNLNILKSKLKKLDLELSLERSLEFLDIMSSTITDLIEYIKLMKTNEIIKCKYAECQEELISIEFNNLQKKKESLEFLKKNIEDGKKTANMMNKIWNKIKQRKITSKNRTSKKRTSKKITSKKRTSKKRTSKMKNKHL